ncbi:hypothetical protein DPMN_056789 [Dreissena polymorpha]|uniref:Uncharacterized protein n=1 Tax=Dreissena polymorpha TaxID=45954 RepID=A0A9D4CV15_DREPO|nr:hypothetical protein DPMN_056789 [Dreissena polymorpha]
MPAMPSGYSSYNPYMGGYPMPQGGEWNINVSVLVLASVRPCLPCHLATAPITPTWGATPCHREVSETLICLC